MAVAYDNATGGISAVNVTSYSGVSHTTGSGADRLLVVTLGYYNRLINATGITYGGVAMTLYKRYNDGTRAVTEEVWYLRNPASGAGTVAVTMSAATGAGNPLHVGAVSWTGADSVTTIEALDTERTVTGSHSTQSDSLTPVNDGCMVCGWVTIGSTSGPTATSGTQRISQADAGSQTGTGFAHSGPVSPAAATAIAWSWTSSTTASAQMVFAIMPVAGTTTLNPSPAVMTWTIPTPYVEMQPVVSPAVMTWNALAPTMLGTVAPGPAASSWNAMTPSLLGTVAPSSAVRVWNAPAPSVTMQLLPLPGVRTWSVNTPVLMGGLLLPAAAMAWVVPAATVITNNGVTAGPEPHTVMFAARSAVVAFVLPGASVDFAGKEAAVQFTAKSASVSFSLP